MKKRITKVLALVLVFALVAGVGISTRDSAAKKNKPDPIKKIIVKNSEAFEDMLIGDEITIKAVVQFSPKATDKQKNSGKKLKYSVKKKGIVKIEKGGKVTAIGVGETKIIVKSKINSKAKAEIDVDVSSGREMIFKYSNLYYIVPEGTPFPVEIAQGSTDANNSTFDIKTLNFDGKLGDFKYTSENSSVAEIDGSKNVLKLNGYGETEIEAECIGDEFVGDSVTVYVLTQAQFDEGKADGTITEEEENTFEDEPEDPNEPEEPEEPDEPETPES
ncbi:MAG: hypothetical protein J5819_07100 [Eubacterium sp.]|nr:hypothetical protein [Eubacterium sp.]